MQYALVLAGGNSREREVSLRSGDAVVAACSRLGYAARAVDIREDQLSTLNLNVDLVFPVLHGGFGEDGRLQQYLQERGVPFVGSGSAASQLAMNKVETRKIWKAHSFRVANGMSVTSVSSIHDIVTQELHLPVAVKPVHEGSSVGVYRCETWESVSACAGRCIAEFGAALVEEWVSGREITVSVLDNRTLPIVEIKVVSGFYDYQAKYEREDTAYLVPASLPPTVTANIQAQAMKAFNTLGCRHYGRIDAIIGADHRAVWLEANTIPGFTDTSLLPRAASAAGMTFDDLVGKLIELGVNRRQ